MEEDMEKIPGGDWAGERRAFLLKGNNIDLTFRQLRVQKLP